MSVVLYYCAVRGVATPMDMLKRPAKDEEPKVEKKVEEKPKAEEKPVAPAEEEDDELDLFGSDDEEDAAVEEHRNRMLALSEAKKKEKGVIAKSCIIFNIKPLDDETDLVELEKLVRGIAMDGLEWKAGRLEDVAFGIQMLVISAHVEDEKVSSDVLEEKIEAFEDYVQSIDIASFSKL